MYQRKVDGDMLNAVKSALADVSSVSPSSDEQVAQKTTLNMLAYYSPVFEKRTFLPHWICAQNGNCHCTSIKYLRLPMKDFIYGNIKHSKN